MKESKKYLRRNKKCDKNSRRESEGSWTEEGLRQGCPLSPTLFTIFMADMEQEFRKEQIGGIRAGSEKFWSLAYADDMVILPRKEEEIDAMIRRLEKYLDSKELELKAEKTKIMICEKGGGREKRTWRMWKGTRIKDSKEYDYLGIKFDRNRNMEGYVKDRIKKAIYRVRSGE